MAITSASTTQMWERHSWISNNAQVRAWVNHIVWITLTGTKEKRPPPSMEPGVPEAEAVANCREVIRHNRLEGLLLNVWGEGLRPLLGEEFYNSLNEARRRTEIYIQEVHWLIGPSLGAQVVLIDDYAMRPYYAHFSGENPRFIQSLSMWTPTLATRQEVIRLLVDGGFEPDRKDKLGYTYVKKADGLSHRIVILGTVWEQARNWSLDLEREIWDRAVAHSTSVQLSLEQADQFLFAARRFAVDSLSGGGLQLRDLVTLVERSSDDVDWDRVRRVMNSIAKPDWLWAAFVALFVFEKNTGKELPLPDWVREQIQETDAFWHDFIVSRTNWSNPDMRLIDFTRAYVKAARGT